MNAAAQTQMGPAPKPESAPAHANLVQRKCACGGSPGVDGECAGCRRHRLTLQRRPADGVDRHALPSSPDGKNRSADLSSEENYQSPAEPRFGHDFGYDFSKVQVHTPVPILASPDNACTCRRTTPINRVVRRS